jgi:hypothetical protein
MVFVNKSEENGALFIDGNKFDGFIDDALCPKCSEPRIYSNKYDAYFCTTCNEWLESACESATCEFCRNRPNKPLDSLIKDPF